MSIEDVPVSVEFGDDEETDIELEGSVDLASEDADCLINELDEIINRFYAGEAYEDPFSDVAIHYTGPRVLIEGGVTIPTQDVDEFTGELEETIRRYSIGEENPTTTCLSL